MNSLQRYELAAASVLVGVVFLATGFWHYPAGSRRKGSSRPWSLGCTCTTAYAGR